MDISKVKINLKDYPDHKCQCGSKLFDTSNIMKIIPPLTVGNPHPEPTLLTVLICRGCEEILYFVFPTSDGGLQFAPYEDKKDIIS